MGFGSRASTIACCFGSLLGCSAPQSQHLEVSVANSLIAKATVVSQLHVSWAALQTACKIKESAFATQRDMVNTGLASFATRRNMVNTGLAITSTCAHGHLKLICKHSSKTWDDASKRTIQFVVRTWTGPQAGTVSDNFFIVFHVCHVVKAPFIYGVGHTQCVSLALMTGNDQNCWQSEELTGMRQNPCGGCD